MEKVKGSNRKTSNRKPALFFFFFTIFVFLSYILEGFFFFLFLCVCVFPVKISEFLTINQERFTVKRYFYFN